MGFFILSSRRWCILSFCVDFVYVFVCQNKTKQFTDNLIECLRKLPEGGFSFSQIPKLFQFQQRYARNRIAVIPFVSDAALLFDADRDCEAQNGVDIAPFLLSNSRCVSSSCRTVKSQGCNGTDTTSEAPRCRPVNFKNSISPRTLSAALAEASPTIAALAVSPRGVRSVFTRPPETCLPQPCPKNSLVSALHSREQPLEAVSADCPSHRSDRFSRNQVSKFLQKISTLCTRPAAFPGYSKTHSVAALNACF